jgi:hypothetical protein
LCDDLSLRSTKSKSLAVGPMTTGGLFLADS